MAFGEMAAVCNFSKWSINCAKWSISTASLLLTQSLRMSWFSNSHLAETWFAGITKSGRSGEVAWIGMGSSFPGATRLSTDQLPWKSNCWLVGIFVTSARTSWKCVRLWKRKKDNTIWRNVAHWISKPPLQRHSIKFYEGANFFMTGARGRCQ